MKKNNGFKSLLIVLFCAMIFGGCGMEAKQADVVTETPTQTITGKIVNTGTITTIVGDGKTTEITSRKIDLEQYSGKEVTVVGEFSGTTLYVDEVK